MNPHPDRRSQAVQREISNFLNAGTERDVHDFISLMSQDNRRLQASFTNMCVAWLERVAQQYQDGNFDIRNADECETAYRMSRVLRQKSTGGEQYEQKG